MAYYLGNSKTSQNNQLKLFTNAVYYWALYDNMSTPQCHRKPLSSTPKTPQFNIIAPSVPHKKTPQFQSLLSSRPKNPSVQHTSQFHTAYIELFFVWGVCWTQEFLVRNWRVCWTKGVLVWKWGDWGGGVELRGSRQYCGTLIQ